MKARKSAWETWRGLTMGLLSTASDQRVSDAAQLTRNTYASLPSQLDPICSLTRVLIPRI